MRKERKMNRTKARKRILTIFVCIFLAILLIFGTVTGIMIAVRNIGAVAKAGAVTVDEGVASYLSSTFKKIYFQTSHVSGSDTEEFWSEKVDGGKTHGERFKEGLKTYISEILAGNLIFNSMTVLSDEDRKIIENTIEDVLYNSADGSVDVFNKKTEKYGYDYDDFCYAAELLYKAERAKDVVYGSDGKNLDSSLADEFLENYTHVSLAFIRTDYTGTPNGTNGIDYEKIPADKVVERENKIEEIKSYIDNPPAMTLATFRAILEDYDGDPNVDYYFLEGMPSTEDFSAQYPGVADKAYQMKNLEFGYVDINLPPDEQTGYIGFVGTCFIYKLEPVSGAYLDKDNTFFEDFYIYASKHFYAKNLQEFSRDVEFTELFDRIDFVKIPKNTDIFLNAWIVGDDEE